MAASDLISPDWELLRNAAADPVRQMIAVEVDTEARTRTAIEALRALDANRPAKVFELDAAALSAVDLLARTVEAAIAWKGTPGLILIADVSRFTEDGSEDRAGDFWRRMNQLRERWDALNAQTVFFLLPANYRLLTRLADHLKRWISLKIHLMGIESDSGWELRDKGQNRSTDGSSFLSPSVAREQLRRLEGELAQAIHRGVAKTALVRRFYLPMFAAAESLKDVGRSVSLREKISEDDLRETELSDWLAMNCELSLSQFDLESGRQFAERLLRHAQNTNDATFEAWAKFYLGRIAQEQRDFGSAEKWYLKSLAISEKQGDEHGAAITYHLLGIIAHVQRDFGNAEKWYLKSLAIWNKQGNEYGAASTYGQLGILAQEQKVTIEAARHTLKALTIFSKCNDQHRVQIATSQFMRFYKEASAAEQTQMKALWKEAGLPLSVFDP